MVIKNINVNGFLRLGHGLSLTSEIFQGFDFVKSRARFRYVINGPGPNFSGMSVYHALQRYHIIRFG